MSRRTKPSAEPRSSTRLRRSAQRLLVKLAQRGPMAHAGQDAETLIAADLATRRPDGTLAISPVGAAHLARLESARAGTIDPFLGQHLEITHDDIQTPAGRSRVAMDAAESPLAWLARRKSRDGRALIEPVQLQAGERLRADFTQAHLMPRITANWMSSIAQNRRTGGTANFSDVVIAARQRVHDALDAVGPEFAGLLVDVCCFLKGVEDVERERGWPSRSAKVVLQLGLDRLARHYGYHSEARGPARAHARTWLAPDAGCTIEG